ncbi:MAG: antibiotic biosynthesis monooxygenase [Desulfobacteraceae bacterium]|nr:antibiotic biosynthesis monooxygenase [Desulfobacteraceae bacterium]
MSVTIFIKRSLKNKTITNKLAPLLVKLRSIATIQPGFITSQTFSNIVSKNEYLIISTWNSLEEWNAWMNSEERMAIQHQVDDLLGEKTIYQYYESIAGGIPPMFQPDS